MNLTMKQKAILTSLYRKFKETGRKDTFVPAKGISSTSMKSFYKTGVIETDRLVCKVPSNMRISDEGIRVMDEYFEKKKRTIDRIITRNKQYIRFIQNTEEKRIELLNYVKEASLITNVDVVHKGYGIFEVIIEHNEPIYYGVYSYEEATAIEIGGCFRIGTKLQYYVEKVKLI